MKNVLSVNDKIAFQRRRALLEQIDYNPATAHPIEKPATATLENNKRTQLQKHDSDLVKSLQ